MHLLERQRVVRLHRRMARRRRGDLLERVFDPQAAIEAFEIFGQRAQRRIAFVGRSSAGIAVTLMLSPPNSSTSNPNRASASAFETAPPARPAAVRGRPGSAAAGSRAIRGQLLHDPLEQHALVRDVLIDDAEPFVVHGDDERVAELARARSSGGRRRRRRRCSDGRLGTRAQARSRPIPTVRQLNLGRPPDWTGGAQRLGKLPPLKRARNRRLHRPARQHVATCAASAPAPGPCRAHRRAHDERAGGPATAP